jgi:hypothetical protein
VFGGSTVVGDNLSPTLTDKPRLASTVVQDLPMAILCILFTWQMGESQEKTYFESWVIPFSLATSLIMAGKKLSNLWRLPNLWGRVRTRLHHVSRRNHRDVASHLCFHAHARVRRSLTHRTLYEVCSSLSALTFKWQFGQAKEHAAMLDKLTPAHATHLADALSYSGTTSKKGEKIKLTSSKAPKADQEMTALGVA